MMTKYDHPTVTTTSFEEILDTKGYLLYTNTGYSMMPLLRQKRDVIEIRKKGPERCKKYDVVLYKSGNRYILHRILKVYPSGYLIAGDHNIFVETDIKDEDILGVMTRVLRNGRNITPNNIWYKLYVHLWCDVYPVRMFLLRIKGFMYRCLRFVKRRVKKLIGYRTSK